MKVILCNMYIYTMRAHTHTHTHTHTHSYTPSFSKPILTECTQMLHVKIAVATIGLTYPLANNIPNTDVLAEN